MSTPRKPVLLIIRDGWGKNPDPSQNATNAVALARKPCDDRLQATAPDSISGKIELRGVGILEYAADRDVPVALVVDLDLDPERLPQHAERRTIAGIEVPVVGLSALEPSAPIKVEAALRLLGLDD